MPLRTPGGEIIDADIAARARYELFKLHWMLTHAFTIGDFLRDIIIYKDINLADEIAETNSTMVHLYSVADNALADWEADAGFSGEIWPSFEEFLTVDDIALNATGFYKTYQNSLVAIATRMMRES